MTPSEFFHKLLNDPVFEAEIRAINAESVRAQVEQAKAESAMNRRIAAREAKAARIVAAARRRRLAEADRRDSERRAVMAAQRKAAAARRAIIAARQKSAPVVVAKVPTSNRRIARCAMSDDCYSTTSTLMGGHAIMCVPGLTPFWQMDVWCA